MPTPTKGARLGGGPAHERHMLANLAQSLFEHGRITTTEAKAKRLRPYAERLVTFAKRGDLASRRRVLGILSDKGVVHTLFTEIGPGYAERDGGYTRITKVGFRKGDNAPLAVIELVEFGTPAKQAVAKEATKATKRAAAAPAKAPKAAKGKAEPEVVAEAEEVAATEAVAQADVVAEDSIASEPIADDVAVEADAADAVVEADAVVDEAPEAPKK